MANKDTEDQYLNVLPGHTRMISLRKTMMAAMAASVAYAALSSLAIAQDRPQDQSNAAQPADTVGIGDIVVTARRKAENLSRVPISVTALGGEALKERAIRTETDLQSAVPGLTVRAAASPIATIFSIRGQTVEQFTGSTPAVLPYVNEVQITPGGASSFFDLSSVQVLKGPQGTLFGRNTTGGAVLYTTTEPGDSFGGDVTLRAGNFNLIEGTGAIDLPVSEKVQLRLAFEVKSIDGYQYNVFDNTSLGSERTQGGRATLVLKPTERLTNKTYIQYMFSKGNPAVNVLYSVNACGAAGLASTAACLYSPSSYSPEVWAAYLAKNPGRNPGGIIAELAARQAAGPYVANSAATLNFFRSKNFYTINTTSYELTDNATLKNIFGYSNSRLAQASEVSGSPFLITSYISDGGYSGYITNQKSISDELQIQGKALDGRLEYTAGFYFSKIKFENILLDNFLDVSPIIEPFVANYVYRTNVENEAVYAQASYDLGSAVGVDGLKVSGGFRYTWEHTDISFPLFPNAVYGGQPSESILFHKPSWLVGIDYQVTPTLMLYVAHRGSWRSGGFNGSAPSNPVPFDQGGNLFLPETTKDIEGGAKFNGRVAGRPTTFSFAVFNQWVNGVQRSNNFQLPSGGYVSLTANIPQAQITGFEVDGSIAPTNWLTLGGNLAYTNARFTKGLTAGYTYGPYGDTPRWSGSGFVMLTLPTPEAIGKLNVRGDVFAQSHYYFSHLDNTVNPGTKLPGYALLNGRIELKEIGGSNLSAAFYMKNILNKKYYIGGVAFGTSIGYNTASPGLPRMFGAELSYNF
ncbi:iron complex outermembrane recepter protein [Sphingobium faniae]|nr:iron complex outermembrane recepter protein [Sphingobium faniae]